MRDIKFRGYDTKRNKWVYGYLVKEYEYEENEKELQEIEKYFIYEVDESEKQFIKTQHLNFNIDKSSIGQFTELYDCNNKPIYEFDMVSYKNEIGIIQFVLGQYIICTDNEVYNLHDAIISNSKVEFINTAYEYLKSVK